MDAQGHEHKGEGPGGGQFTGHGGGDRTDSEPKESKMSSLKEWFGDSRVVDEKGEPRVIDGFIVRLDRDLPKQPSPRLMNVWKLGQEIGRATESVGFETHYNTGVRQQKSRIISALEKAGRQDLIDKWIKVTKSLEGDRFRAFDHGMRCTDESWDVPEYRFAWRYSAPPKSGYSYNFRDEESLIGVSVVALLDSDTDVEKQKENVNAFYETGGKRQKYYIGGWFFGATGSDGEPLLHEVDVIDKDTLKNLKSVNEFPEQTQTLAIMSDLTPHGHHGLLRPRDPVTHRILGSADGRAPGPQSGGPASSGDAVVTEEAPPSEPKHKYATTQFDLVNALQPHDQPGVIPELVRFATEIPHTHLAEDGRETDLHVTICYGIIEPETQNLATDT